MNLLSAIKAVKHAVGKDKTRPNLQAIRIEPDSGGTVVVATDGHRLATAQIKENRISACTLNMANPVVLQSIKAGTIAATIVSGDVPEWEYGFPRWRTIVPTNNPCRIVVDRQEFIAQLHPIQRTIEADYKIVYAEKKERVVQARIAHKAAPNSNKTKDALNRVREFGLARAGILLNVAEGRLLIGRQEGPLTEVAVVGRIVGGDPVQIFLDGRYLLQALKRFTEIAVTLELAEALAPIRIVAESGYEVIMPQREK